jgi:diguanylate cyclase (GGDEF)-like protein
MKSLFSNDTESLTALGFGIVLGLSMTLIFFTLLQLARWNEASFELVMDATREAEHTHRMRDSIRQRELAIQHMLNATSDIERQRQYGYYLQYVAEYDAALEAIQQRDTSAGIQAQYQRLHRAVVDSHPYQQRLIGEIMKGSLSHDELHAIALEASVEQENVVDLLDRLVDLQRQRYMQVVDDYQARRDSVLIMTAAIFSIGVVVSILVMRFSGSRYRYVSRLSVMDEVTGTYNRRYFDMVMEEEWKRSMRECTPISLIMIDIDFFKDYNDAFGHQLGDVCLFSVAKILAAQLRRAADLIARYGGEEFAIVLPNTNAENARIMAERMRRAVEEARIQSARDDVSPWLSISLGVATTTAEFQQVNMVLIRAADKCLYQSKAAGRNRVTDINLASVDD